MSELHRSTSRYVNTKVRDFYLDIWEPVFIPSSANDEVIVLGAKYEGRPDLLSYDKYGTEEMWWVFAIANPDILENPLDDFVAGITITVPSMRTLERLY